MITVFVIMLFSSLFFSNLLNIVHAHSNALHRSLAHARLVLLNDEPLATGSLSSLHKVGNILNTATQRTELKSTIRLLLILVKTNKCIRVANLYI